MLDPKCVCIRNKPYWRLVTVTRSLFLDDLKSGLNLLNRVIFAIDWVPVTLLRISWIAPCPNPWLSKHRYQNYIGLESEIVSKQGIIY